MSGAVEPVVVGARGVTVADVHAVTVHDAPVRLAPDVAGRLHAERAVVDAAVREQLPVYGVTTGLGARSHVALEVAELRAMSLRTVRGRAVATGEPLPREVVRAALLARAASFARGGSGVRPEVAEAVVALLEHRVHPVVPSIGSIGSSDLVQMAHVALVLVGEGTAEVDGTVVPGAEAMAAAGLAPLVLGPKEGLALCAGSPLTAGVSALAVYELDALVRASATVLAGTYEAWRAGVGVLDERVLDLRRQPGQSEAAALVRGALAGGDLLAGGRGRRLQDPVSIRSAVPVLASLLAAGAGLRAAVEAELAGNGDNPVVLDGAIVSTGNFHPAYLALALDAAALGVAQDAACSVARLQRLLEPALSGLPLNLSPRAAYCSGLAPLVKAGQALVARVRHAASPVSTDPRTGAAGVEDDSTNAPLGAERLRRVVGWHRRVLALEALAAVQGLDLLPVDSSGGRPPVVGAGVARLRAAVRAVSPAVDDDRSLSGDIAAVETVLGAL